MNKAVDFLEKNVQWLALGLGALYLLYMVYAYVLQSPLVVTGVGGQPLGPGEVDRAIQNGSANNLRIAINQTSTPAVPSVSFVEGFQKQLAFRESPVQAFAGAGPFTPLVPREKVELSPQQGAPNLQRVQVAQLPDLPPAVITGVTTGRTNVLLPPDPNQPQQPQQPAPGQPFQPAPQPNAQLAGLQVDKTWATVMYTIDVPAIATQFREKGVPPELSSQTAFIDVELLREEKMPDGSWGNPTTIKPLSIHQQMRPPFPPDNATPAQTMEYYTWARGASAVLLQPSFYAMSPSGGDPWILPGFENQLAANQQPMIPAGPFDPKQYIHLDFPAIRALPLDDQQKRQIIIEKQKYMKEQRDAARQQRQGNRPARPARPGRGGEEIMDPAMEGMAPLDPDRAANARQYRPPAPGYGRPPMPGAPPMYGADEGMGMVDEFGNPIDGGMGYQPSQPGHMQIQQGQFPIPLGEFDPTAGVPVATGWAHDDTLQPGKTYRYTVSYKIKNPIYLVSGVANPPQLADQFAIESAASQPSTEVTAPINTDFWIAANWANTASNVKFEVATWVNGAWTSKVYAAGPGDQIGQMDQQAGTDFATGWTVVDLRVDPRSGGDPYVLLLDPSGQIVRRDFRSDAGNERIQKLKADVEAAKKAAQPLAARPNF